MIATHFLKAPTAAARVALQEFAPPEGMVTLKYDVHLLTAIMGGGVSKGKADPDKPFRAESIKGQLRYWWRVLARAGCLAIPACQVSAPSAADLRVREGNLWGMLDTQRPKRSRVGLVVRHSGVTRPVCLVDLHNRYFGGQLNPQKGDWMTAYFAAEGERKYEKAFILPGHIFTLEVCIPKADQSEIKLAISLWATLGGLGSRTRRGAGAVEVYCVSTPERRLLNAFVDHKELINSCFKHVKRDAPDFTVNGALMDYLCQFDGHGQSQSHHNALMAQIDALGSMRRFRQGEPAVPPGPKFVRRGGRNPGRSPWTEPDMIRRSTGLSFTKVPARRDHHGMPVGGPGHSRNHSPVPGGGDFAPRASFGMPLVIKFHDQQRPPNGSDTLDYDPATRSLIPDLDDVDRMASPIILRPVAFKSENGVQYKAVAALIPNHPFRQLTTVQVKLQAGHLPGASIPVWHPAWNRPGPAATAIPPALNLASKPVDPFPQVTNAVEAFMNFFAQNA